MLSLKAVFLSSLIIATTIVYGETKTLDFSNGEHSFSVFESGGIELEPFKGIPYLRTIDAGTYRVLLPGNIEYLLEIDRGEVRNHLEKEGHANIVKLVTSRLSLEATKKLAYTFHRQFKLDEKELDKWFVQLEAGENPSVYGKGYNSNFPGMGLSLRTTFGKEQPAFIIFNFNWDERAAKKLNRSLESNKQLNVTYDMPKLLEGVPEFTEFPEVEPVIVKVNNPQPIVAQASKPESAIEEPAEVAPVEEIEEAPVESSQWWLWLIGLLVVIGGLALVVRRKN